MLVYRNASTATVDRLQTSDLRFCGSTEQTLARLRGALSPDKFTHKAFEEMSALLSYLRMWGIEKNISADLLLPPPEDYYKDLYFQIYTVPESSKLELIRSIFLRYEPEIHLLFALVKSLCNGIISVSVHLIDICVTYKISDFIMIKAKASVAPQQWQPNSGLVMTNDVLDTKPEEAVPCIALSKNDSYVMSACGGKISFFNMMTFKVMTTFMSPLPASTYLAFHLLDNNIITIGMEDFTIRIYNVWVDEVKTKMIGHLKRITGLAFKNNLNILVSFGADAQLCIWNTDSWEKKKSNAIQLPVGKAPVQYLRCLTLPCPSLPSEKAHVFWRSYHCRKVLAPVASCA